MLILLIAFPLCELSVIMASPKQRTIHNQPDTRNGFIENKGLVVIGIDPVDKKEDDLKSFLAKRGVTYDVLLGGNDIARDYHLSRYPTVYILDKNGKILFAFSGYWAGEENILEDVIVKAL